MRLLAKHLWVDDHARAEALWGWKHFGSPWGKSRMLIAADAADNIIGFVALMPHRLRVGSQVIAGFQLADLVVDARYRGQGIGTALFSKISDSPRGLKNAVLIAIPNRFSYPLILKQGWHPIDDFYAQIRFSEPFRVALHLARSRFNVAKQYAEEDFFKSGACVLGARRETSSLLSDSRTCNLIDTDQSCERNEGLALAKDVQYLRWRYQDHPAVHYYAVTHETQSQLDAAILFRTMTTDGLKGIMIVEFLTTSQVTGRELLEKLYKIVEVDFIAARIGPASIKREILRESGLKLSRKHLNIRFLVDQVNWQTAVDLSSSQNWADSVSSMEEL